MACILLGLDTAAARGPPARVCCHLLLGPRRALPLFGNRLTTYAIHDAMVPGRFWSIWAAWFALAACSLEKSGSNGEGPPLAALAAANAAHNASAPEREPTPLVDLSGTYRPAKAQPVNGDVPRIYARSLRTWIYTKPTTAADKLGYLRAGASLPTGKTAVGFDQCPGGWYAVAPKGFACAGSGATLDSNDPIVRATLAHPPEFARKLPYIYGTVRKPGPVYARLPSDAELAEAEPGLAERIERWLTADGEIGASYAQQVWLGNAGQPPDPRQAWNDRTTDTLPQWLLDPSGLPSIHRNPRDPGQLIIDRMRPRVGYSFLETFFWHGRRYGLSTELEVLPVDRLRPIQGSEFHGFELGKGLALPIAIVRHPNAHYYVYQSSSNHVLEDSVAPYRQPVALTGKNNFFNGVLHYETQDGKWLSDRQASRLDPVKKPPGWAVQGEKWIDVNITKQTLVLYEGTKPVYATLVSTGEAGLEDPEHTTATRRGIFRIHTKHVSTTMASDELGEEFELRDVPYVQYFDKQGYALHGAYWHDRFGVPKSHGCINLAPEDARRIFHWTEPRVPEGWHGALSPLKGTILFVHP